MSTIDIKGWASVANGLGALLDVFVDGTQVGEIAVNSGSPQDYLINATLAQATANDIQITYDPSAQSTGAANNFYLQSVSVDSQPVPTASLTYHDDGNAYVGRGDMNGSGYLDVQLAAGFIGGTSSATTTSGSSTPTSTAPSTPSTSATTTSSPPGSASSPTAPTSTPTSSPTTTSSGGTDTIALNGWASVANGHGALLDVIVDGTQVGQIAVNSSSTQAYTVTTTLAPGTAHDIQIVYDPSAQSTGSANNFYLQSVSADNQAVPSADLIYHDDGNAFVGSGDMNGSGYLEIQLPAGFVSGSTSSTTTSGSSTPTSTAPSTPSTPSTSATTTSSPPGSASSPTAPTSTPTSSPTTTSSGGTDTITLNGWASVANGHGALLDVIVDGTQVGQIAVNSSSTQAYTVTTTLAPGTAHDIQIVYDPSAQSTGSANNFYLQSVSADNQAVPSADLIYHDDGNASVGSGDMNGSGYLEIQLPAGFVSGSTGAGSTSAGSTPAPTPTPTPTPTPIATPPATTPTPTPTSGSDTVTVNASATIAGGVGAHFDLIVDGTDVGQATVDSTTTQAYSFQTTLTPGEPHDIQLVYNNDAVVDGVDRNLYLQSLTIDGQTVPATSSNEVYHATGVGNYASDGTMYWNGTAEFALPASYFPLPTTSSSSGGATTTTAPTGPAYYVATNGSDSNDGSAAHPFATLGHAQAAMEGSSIETTYIEGGTYDLSAPLALGAADQGETWAAYPGQQVILDGQNALGTLISLSDTSHVTIQGLEFADTTTAGAAVSLSGSNANQIVANLFSATGEGLLLAAGSSGNTVSGNEFNNSVTSAVEVKDGSNSNVLDNNLINGVGASNTSGGAFFLHGVSDNTISHNEISNTAGAGINIANWDDTTVNIGNVVEYNLLTDTNQSASDSGAIYVLGRSQVNTDTTIDNNMIVNAGSPSAHTVGIYLDDSTSGVTVDNNIVQNGGQFAVQIHGGSNVTVQNNILDLGAGGTTGILFQSTVFSAGAGNTDPTNAQTDNVVTQNIITSSSSAPSIYESLSGGNPDIHDNLYYNSAGASMQTLPPTQDTHPVYGNPAFVDPSTGNYALGSGSAASQIGFEAIDTSQIGLHSTANAWWVIHS